MQMKLLGITNIDFVVIGQQLIRCSISVKILEKKWEYNGTVHQLFVDVKKAYDSVRREVLYNILIEFGILRKILLLLLLWRYSPKWTLAASLIRLHPSRFRAAILQFLHPP
jgi:hypothetical protein